MADHPADAAHPSEAVADANDAAQGAAPPGVPRWVKVSGVVAVVLVLLVVVVMVASGGQHGPGMHVPQ